VSTIIIKATNEIIDTTKKFNILKFFCFFDFVFICVFSLLFISIFSLVSSSKFTSNSSLDASDTLSTSLISELFCSKILTLSLLISSSVDLLCFQELLF